VPLMQIEQPEAVGPISPPDSVPAVPGPSSQPFVPMLPRGLSMVLGAAGTAVTVTAMRDLSWLLGPVFLSLMLVIAVAPAQALLRRLRLPGWLATVISLFLVYAILVALAALIYYSVSQLVTLLPKYQQTATELIKQITAQLTAHGINTDIAGLTSQLDVNKVTDLATSLLSSLTSVTSSSFFVLALLLFMSLDAANFGERLATVRVVRPSVVAALTAFAVGTRRYLVVSSFFGLVCSVFDLVALELLQVPLPLLWAVLAFMTNYIPNIGFVVGLVPPALLALLDGGPREMVLTIAAYLVINIVIQTIIAPKFVGDVVGLSVTMTFLATAFWAWVLGPLGALLAIPMTLLAKALLIDADPSTRWVDTLIGASPPSEG
jgi:AI-2 transport protein TqsA